MYDTVFSLASTSRVGVKTLYAPQLQVQFIYNLWLGWFNTCKDSQTSVQYQQLVENLHSHCLYFNERLVNSV